MGDKILMKVLITLLFLLSLVQGNEMAWVDQQIEAIKPLRKGLQPQQVDKLQDPFIYLLGANKQQKTTQKQIEPKQPIAKKETHSYKAFHLQAIMNSAALIDGKWYKNGSYVYGYKLLIQNRTEVILKNKTQRLVLSTKKKIKTLKLH